MREKKTVAVALSGGVDSSVAAYLLKEQGYNVIGITMVVCEDVDVSKEAKEVADMLDIPFYKVDLSHSFNEKVVGNFIHEYCSGRTPNPCVECNKYIKFGKLFQEAKALGADFLATGHYASIIEEKGRYLIINAEDSRKDQTYMLYGLKQEALKHILMPCGKYSKEKIRSIAKKIGLKVHDKKDSMEICFIADNNHGKYIKDRVDIVKIGDFIDKSGNKLGEHKGIINYTIGQRKGLGISFGKPMFVIDILPETNQVVLGEEKFILKNSLIAKDINFIPFDYLDYKITLEAKVRYSAKKALADVEPYGEDRIKITFKEKQRAITKGQSVVFYSGDMLVGGGVIEEIC
ncbi:tRNA 2-thiouridine(34) synthase MnmA [Clostridium sediminicola]|uniref:tRNA 2-thiouridine(34) synthase MnmA n=1 Tax=Clostridium sediminicola TaxID=3114879 RepID=UPI0031F25F8A